MFSTTSSSSSGGFLSASWSGITGLARRSFELPIVVLVPLAGLVAWDATKEGLALWRW